jgi:DNA-binding IclR family transcriptional regulator
MNSLEAAMRVLKLLDKRRPVLRVGEISRELSLQKSTVSRLLRTLSEHELLEREREGQGYTVGRRSLVLSDLYLVGHTLLNRIEAVLDALVDEFGLSAMPACYQAPISSSCGSSMGATPCASCRMSASVSPPSAPPSAAPCSRASRTRRRSRSSGSMARPVPPARPYSKNLRESDARAGRLSRGAIIPGIAAVGAAVGDPARNEALGFALSFPMTATDELLRERMARTVRDEARRIGERLGDPFWADIRAFGQVDGAGASRTVQRRSRRPQRTTA